jgi:hypothetical protein
MDGGATRAAVPGVSAVTGQMRVPGGVCAMAPERVHRMTRERFVEIMRAVTCVEEHQVPSISGFRWRMFRTAPLYFFLNGDDADTQAIWDALPDRLKQ